MLIINKNKKSTDIIFRDEQIKQERVVKIDEIEKNDWCLSVNNYIFKEKEQEKVDIIELELTARRGTITQLEKQLQFSIQIYQMEEENQEFKEKCNLVYFLDDLLKILEKYTQEAKGICG